MAKDMVDGKTHCVRVSSRTKAKVILLKSLIMTKGDVNLSEAEIVDFALEVIGKNDVDRAMAILSAVPA